MNKIESFLKNRNALSNQTETILDMNLWNDKLEEEFRQELEKERESNASKRIKIHDRLVKAFRAPSRLTVRSDSINEDDSTII
jgi:hypothetical protein